MRKSAFLLKVFLLLPFSLTAFSNNQKPDLRILNKCYSQLLDKRIPYDHPLVEKVQKGQIRPIEACDLLVQNLSFNKDGILKGDSALKNLETRKILRTFQRLHDSWFTRYNLNLNTQDYTNSDIYDTNEMGYHFTYALFGNENIKNVITKKRTFKSIREREKEAHFLIDRNISGYRHPKVSPYSRWKVGGAEKEGEDSGEDYLGPVSFWKPHFVEVGTLIGLIPYTKSEDSIKKWIPNSKDIAFDIHEPHGAGILGSVPYLMLNAGQINQKANGGNILHRRWSTSLLSDLMCRELPLFSEDEVTKKVLPESKILFQRDKACVSCHATIDPMASVLRNMENYNSGDVSRDFSIRNVYFHEVHSELKMNSGNYYQTLPKGEFFYKDIFGKVIEKEIRNLSQLGQELSQTKDFYHCISSRYFQFFTGRRIKVDSKDYTRNPTQINTFVRSLAEKLEGHQSLKKLIKDIYHSEYYRR